MTPMPTITLKNGVRIANFSSPHSFTFDDGSVLPACTPERAVLGKLSSVEVEHPMSDPGSEAPRWVDIDLEFRMSPECLEMLNEAMALWNAGEVDIVIVPFPVLTAWKAGWDDHYREEFGSPHQFPFRTIRTADRVNKINFSNRFCF